MQRKNYGPYMHKGRSTSSHDVSYATRTPTKKTVLACVMLVLVALWIASNNVASLATVDTNNVFSSYGIIETGGSVVQKFQLLWGGFGMSQEYAACAHFDMCSVGYWGDPGADYQYIPSFKHDYPNCKILGYIDLSWITSADWMVSQWNTYGAPYGYDGIFIDDCSPSLGVSGVSNTQALLDTLLQTLKSRLPSMLICANGVETVRDGVPVADTYNYVDIGCSECFAYAPPEWDRSSQDDINSLAYWTGRGKTIATFHSCSPAVNGVADTLANCQYALACYLCGVQGNNGYFSWSDVWTGTAQGYYPIMDIDPGTPLGPYAQVGNILYRNFTKVNVTVDLTAMTEEIEVIP